MIMDVSLQNANGCSRNNYMANKTQFSVLLSFNRFLIWQDIPMQASYKQIN